jgi:hypothetical protein
VEPPTRCSHDWDLDACRGLAGTRWQQASALRDYPGQQPVEHDRIIEDNRLGEACFDMKRTRLSGVARLSGRQLLIGWRSHDAISSFLCCTWAR